MKFKKFYYLTEGGLGSHISHPYDILSPMDFLKFYEDFFSGKLNISEKLDGLNLFVGLNDEGKLTFARNENESPSTNIESKFSLSSPAGDAFRSGFQAIKQGIELFQYYF